MHDDDDHLNDLRLVHDEEEDSGDYEEPYYPRLDEAEITTTVSYYNCGECRVMHKTHDTALKCIAAHVAKRERERRNRPPDRFTLELKREAARTVSSEDAAVEFAKKNKVDLYRVVEVACAARFYWARLLANDGVVRRETRIDALGFTDDSIATLKSDGIDCVLYLLVQTSHGWSRNKQERPMLGRHADIVVRELGRWPLVKPSFLE